MGHEMQIILPPHQVLIEADPVRLAQAISNLLNNAAKYSERNGHIRVAAAIQGHEVSVSVRDSGIGIAPEQFPQLFVMFSQVNSAQGKSQGGLGIGLTLVKQLVEMHGGRVEAKSDGLGRGAEFILRLPIAVESSAAVTAVKSAESTGQQRAWRILIVDDNRDGADSLTTMLRLQGHETRTAYDGEQGVAEAEAYRPEIVLLDIGLPKMNGYDVCRTIRARPWGKSILMLALTGWGQDDDRRKSSEAGFDRHLVKPVDPKLLIELLADSKKKMSQLILVEPVKTRKLWMIIGLFALQIHEILSILFDTVLRRHWDTQNAGGTVTNFVSLKFSKNSIYDRCSRVAICGFHLLAVAANAVADPPKNSTAIKSTAAGRP